MLFNGHPSESVATTPEQSTLHEWLFGLAQDLAGLLAIILIVFAIALVVTDLAQFGLAIQGRG